MGENRPRRAYFYDYVKPIRARSSSLRNIIRVVAVRYRRNYYYYGTGDREFDVSIRRPPVVACPLLSPRRVFDEFGIYIRRARIAASHDDEGGDIPATEPGNIINTSSVAPIDIR